MSRVLGTTKPLAAETAGLIEQEISILKNMRSIN
jgi:hypothetical protein